MDGNNEQVTYLSESGKVITGTYTIDEDVTLKKIKIQDSSVFENEESFDVFVNEKMHSFIEGIHYSEYGRADDNFTDILTLWENRLKLSSVKSRLQEQCSKLNETEKILGSDEFQNLIEVIPQLSKFLGENLEKIIQVPEIRNAVNLSNAVSQAFNFPRITLDELQEQGVYSLNRGVNESIYEMVCRQELIKKEILESKRDFEMVWASSPAIKQLASMVFEDAETTVGALSEALVEVPYLALASKKSLFETFSNCLTNVDGAIGVTEKDIQEFSSRIFEYKKDVKEVFIRNINEKYGVNIQNLQDPASFKSLANTQVVIFEALSRLSTKGSVLKSILSEMAQSLKGKHGVECIDVNDFLLEMFIAAGYEVILEEDSSSKVDFKRITGQLSDISLEDVAEAVDPSSEDQVEGPEEADQQKEDILAQEEEDAKEANQKVDADPDVKTGKDAIEDLADIDKVVAEVVKELGNDFDTE